MHACLIAEEHLRGQERTFVPNLDISRERTRVLQHLLGLSVKDNLPQRPMDTPQVDQTVQHVDKFCVPAPLSRAKRLRRSFPVVSSSLFSPILSRNCKNKGHKNVGCAAASANHYPGYFNSGNFGDKICSFCKALLLPGENSKKCCVEGKVSLRLRPALPDYLQILRDHNLEFQGAAAFRKQSKKYNALLSMASVIVGQERQPAGAFWSVSLLNGDFHRLIGDLMTVPGQAPRYLGCYFIDADQAMEARVTSPISKNNRLNVDILTALHKMLLSTHPVARSCQLMKELYDSALVEALQNSLPDVAHVQLTLLNERDVSANVSAHFKQSFSQQNRRTQSGC